MAEVELRDVDKFYGDLQVVRGVSFTLRDREFLALLGPSGCGKTTTLRMIGGFIRTDGGQILIDGKDMTDVPPERRPTAMVFQNYALWPHMTVGDNIAFGLKLRKVPKVQIAERVRRMLDVVRLEGVEQRYPSQLSGGQQQRVALARALVLGPDILLLDEPLSNLDAKLRVRMRDEIRRIQQELQITTIYVTHDQEEALTMADRIAVMNKGVIEQLGDSGDIYDRPETPFVADFIGQSNFFDATLEGGPEGMVVRAGALVIPVDAAGLGVGTPVTVSIRPEDIEVVSGPAGGSSFELEDVRVLSFGAYKRLLGRHPQIGQVETRVPKGFQIPAGLRLRIVRARAFARAEEN